MERMAMGTVIPRKLGDGSTRYQAQLLIKRAGKIVHREGRTFERKVVRYRQQKLFQNWQRRYRCIRQPACRQDDSADSGELSVSSGCDFRRCQAGLEISA